MRRGWVYIMADRYRGTIYVGVTSGLAARIHQHRTGDGSDFCRRYGLHRLVYADSTELVVDAIAREGDEEVAEGVEGRADRGSESGMA